jgi:hypothetical protein
MFFFFFFNLFATFCHFYRRPKRPDFLRLPSKLITPSLQKDEIGELRTDSFGPNSDMSPMHTASFNKFRGSIAWTEGFEKNLHVLAKDQYPERAMGVFTSGGDAQGSLKPFISYIYIYICMNYFFALLHICLLLCLLHVTLCLV